MKASVCWPTPGAPVTSLAWGPVGHCASGRPLSPPLVQMINDKLVFFLHSMSICLFDSFLHPITAHSHSLLMIHERVSSKTDCDLHYDWLNCNCSLLFCTQFMVRVRNKVRVCIKVVLTLWRPLLPYGYSYKASCVRQVKPSFVFFWHPGTLTLIPECPGVKVFKDE